MWVCVYICDKIPSYRVQCYVVVKGGLVRMVLMKKLGDDIGSSQEEFLVRFQVGIS